MRIRNLLLVGTMIGVPVLASAQTPISGLYVGAGAGANFLQNENLKTIDIGTTKQNYGKTKLQANVGVRGLASVGYGFGNGLRVEVEGDYFINGISGVGRNYGGGVSGLGTNFARYNVNVKGQEQKYGGFANVLYDFTPQMFGVSSFPLGVMPYVGLGAGYLQVKNHNLNLADPSGNYLFRNHGTDGGFAYQGIVGAAFPLPYVSGLALTVEYRFTSQLDNRTFKGQYFAANTTQSARFHEAGDYNHTLMLGVRYAFNNAPPPPPPAPVPVAAPVTAPSRSYLVFFDWDRADLTARARQIVADAAQNSTRVQYTRIEVNGYTDLSGTAAYNQGLSVRRAQSVASELVRDGVPQAAINIQGFGETHPLVATAKGVREPQNRRVEIIIR